MYSLTKPDWTTLAMPAPITPRPMIVPSAEAAPATVEPARVRSVAIPPNATSAKSPLAANTIASAAELGSSPAIWSGVGYSGTGCWSILLSVKFAAR